MSKRSFYLTASERQIIWDRWQRGDRIKDIAGLLSRAGHTVARELDLSGGIRPPPRTRSARALSLVEREGISRGLSAGRSLRAIAADLGRAPSTISREVKRNGGVMRYRALSADERAWDQAKRPKFCLLSTHPRLRDQVADWLSQQWSPEQISGQLIRAYPTDKSMRVSHETIYRTLYVQARGTLKKELVTHLRKQQPRRRPTSAQKRHGGSITGELSISERPAEVADRAVPGHWEGDLLCGSHGSQIATLVERRSRFVMLIKIPDKNSIKVADILAEHVQRLPAELRRSLTWDRGIEMASHMRFTVATDVKVYFCDPYSPWQRGSNENTNGLLRQYFPKGTDLSVHSQEYLDEIARRLNGRPRKTLDWAKPDEVLQASVAPTS